MTKNLVALVNDGGGGVSSSGHAASGSKRAVSHSALPSFHRDRVKDVAGDITTGNGDFAQLQREYRNLEINRKVYADESHQVMRRQQQLIEKLKQENEQLKNEIQFSTLHFQKTFSSSHKQQEIAKLKDQMETYQKKTTAESKKLELVMQQIAVLRHKILHQKKHLGGVNASAENHALVAKQIRILENRLDKSLTKFNEALAQNKVLRNEIENLRHERVLFDQIYRKMEKEHADKKKQMANTIEMSNLAYEQRDAAQLELRSIQEANRVENENHRKKIVEIAQILEQSKASVGSGLTPAGTAGASAGSNASGLGGMSPTSRGGGGGEGGGAMGSPENDTKRKLLKGSWGIAKEKVHVQVSIERVQNFEEAFVKIRAATGISDVEELVNTFLKKEDQNFSLFNFVNEQNNEMEKMQDLIAQLQIQEKKFSDENGQDVSAQKQILHELDNKVQTTELAAQKMENRCNEAQKILNAAKIAIQTLFTKMGCNSQLMVELLGDNTVTENNMLQYLGMIEQKTNDILKDFAFAEKTKSTLALPPSHASTAGATAAAAAQNTLENSLQDSSGLHTTANGSVILPSSTVATPATVHAAAVQSMLGLGPMTPMGQEPLQINPPNLEDYSSEDEDSGDNEDNMHPLTRDELKVRTLKGLRRLNHHHNNSPNNNNNNNGNKNDPNGNTSGNGPNNGKSTASSSPGSKHNK